MSYRGRPGNAQRRHKNVNVPNPVATEDASPVVKLFQTYQIELDTRYDKYERLIKKSRDLTIESKRIIFLLHRISSDGDNNDEILLEAETRLSNLFKDVISGISSELSKRELYQYLRAFSPGLQEFVEAISYYHYLKNGNIIHIEEVHNPDFVQKSSEVPGDLNAEMENPEPGLPLSSLLMPTDFILGLADLTGELMRKCINSVGAGNIDEPFRLCSVLLSIHEALSNCNYNKELKRKLFTLKSSLQKVENACYAIKIRGSEIPKHMLADFFSNEEEYKDNIDCDI